MEAEPALGKTPEPSPPPSATTAAPADPSDPGAPSVETFFVHEARAACELEGPRECLQVRGAESEPWRNFFGSIQGFEHEPSYRYELRVEVTPRPDPPPGAAAFSYRLVEVVSKRKADL